MYTATGLNHLTLTTRTARTCCCLQHGPIRNIASVFHPSGPFDSQAGNAPPCRKGCSRLKQPAAAAASAPGWPAAAWQSAGAACNHVRMVPAICSFAVVCGQPHAYRSSATWHLVHPGLLPTYCCCCCCCCRHADSLSKAACPSSCSGWQQDAVDTLERTPFKVTQLRRKLSHVAHPAPAAACGHASRPATPTAPPVAPVRGE